MIVVKLIEVNLLLPIFERDWINYFQFSRFVFRHLLTEELYASDLGIEMPKMDFWLGKSNSQRLRICEMGLGLQR